MATRCYIDRYGRQRCQRTGVWNDWVRWLVMALILAGFLTLFMVCSCITARKRRKAGRNPYYGTGWTTRVMPGNNNSQQPYQNNNQYGQSAPPYSAKQETGANQGYYGGAQPHHGQQGVELQSPQPAYHGGYGGGDNYMPPPGPPPSKMV